MLSKEMKTKLVEKLRRGADTEILRIGGGAVLSREECAALVELNVEDFLDELDARLKAEETPGWRTPANRTEREYAARQARMAVGELRYKIVAYNEATAE